MELPHNVGRSGGAFGWLQALSAAGRRRPAKAPPILLLPAPASREERCA